MADTLDRTVHAESERLEVVRYDRAGRWYIESKLGAPREAATLTEACSVAHCLVAAGGRIHFNRPGGQQFDARMRRRLSVTPSRTDRQPRDSVAGAKGGQGTEPPT